MSTKAIIDVQEVLTSARNIMLYFGRDNSISDEVVKEIREHDIHKLCYRRDISEHDKDKAVFYSTLLKVYTRRRNAPIVFINKSIRKSIQRLKANALEPLISSEVETVSDAMDLIGKLQSGCKQIDRPTKRRKMLYEEDYTQEAWRVVYAYIICWLGFDELDTPLPWVARDLLNCKASDRLAPNVTKRSNIDAGYLLFLLDCFTERPLEFLDTEDLPGLQDICEEFTKKHVIKYLEKVTRYSEYTLVCFMVKKLLDSETLLNSDQVIQGQLDIGRVVREDWLRTPASYRKYLDELSKPSDDDNKDRVRNNAYPLVVELELMMLEENYFRAIGLAGDARANEFLSENDKDFLYYVLFEGMLKSGVLLYESSRPTQKCLSELYLRNGGNTCLNRFLIQLSDLEHFISRSNAFPRDVKEYIIQGTKQTVVSMLLEKFATVEAIPSEFVRYLDFVEIPALPPNEKTKWAWNLLKQETVYPSSWNGRFSSQKMNDLVLRWNQMEPATMALLEKPSIEEPLFKPIEGAQKEIEEIESSESSNEVIELDKESVDVDEPSEQYTSSEEDQMQYRDELSDEHNEHDVQYSAETSTDENEPPVQGYFDEEKESDSERTESEISEGCAGRDDLSDDDGGDSDRAEFHGYVLNEVSVLSKRDVVEESGYYGEESQVTEGTEEEEEYHPPLLPVHRHEPAIDTEALEEKPIPAMPPATEQHVDEGYMPEAEDHPDEPPSIETKTARLRLRGEESGYDGEGSQGTEGEEDDHEISHKNSQDKVQKRGTETSEEEPAKLSLVAEEEDKGYEREGSPGQVDVNTSEKPAQRIASVIASGYDAEASQPEDDAEVSEVNTEDEDEKNRGSDSHTKGGVDEAIEIPGSRVDQPSLSDMSAADELTFSQEEDLGAESSEFDEHQDDGLPVSKPPGDELLHGRGGGVLHKAALAAYKETTGKDDMPYHQLHVAQTTTESTKAPQELPPGESTSSPLHQLADLASTGSVVRFEASKHPGTAAEVEETKEQPDYGKRETSDTDEPAEGAVVADDDEEADEETYDKIQEQEPGAAVAEDDEAEATKPQPNESEETIQTVKKALTSEKGKEESSTSAPDYNRDEEPKKGSESPARSVTGKHIDVTAYSPAASSIGMHSLNDDMSAAHDEEAVKGEREDDDEASEPRKTPKTGNTKRVSEQANPTTKRTLELDSSETYEPESPGLLSRKRKAEATNDESTAGSRRSKRLSRKATTSPGLLSRKRKAEATDDESTAGSRRSKRLSRKATTSSRVSMRSKKSPASVKLEAIEEESVAGPSARTRRSAPSVASRTRSHHSPASGTRSHDIETKRNKKEQNEDEKSVRTIRSTRSGASSLSTKYASKKSAPQKRGRPQKEVQELADETSTKSEPQKRGRPSKKVRDEQEADETSNKIELQKSASKKSAPQKRGRLQKEVQELADETSTKSEPRLRPRKKVQDDTEETSVRTTRSKASNRSKSSKQSKASNRSRASAASTVYGRTQSGDPCKTCQRIKGFCAQHKGKEGKK